MRVAFVTLIAVTVASVVASLAAEAPAPPGSGAKRSITFQNGANGYKGAVDLEIWDVAPNTCLEGNINASSDANNDGGESQVLVRFDDIIGTKPGQIPPKSAIHSATLIIGAFDQGTTVHLHRMLVPFKRTSTWNSLVGGVTADGLEASKKKDSFTFGKISASTSAIPFEVTDTVQKWANGDANHGWVFINTGGNGWDFYTSEFDKVKQRPKLVVEFTPPQK
ncbi:MAG: DNRLRE domain-containing protein [Planctomycetia bacterium]|nr:DNRLRE domain-containing protein [Planctomycetia bacterium]